MLVDGRHDAFLGSFWPIAGAVTAGDFLVEFRARSIDGGIHSRAAIFHYRIDREKVTRVDPLALSPRDFVEEWLTHEWVKEAADWSEGGSRPSRRDWHLKLHKDFVSGSNAIPTRHCASSPDLWQVAFDFSEPPTPWDKPPVATYFLVRWRPPYRFTMVRVGSQPDLRCKEVDPAADEQPTLFPGR